MARHRNIRIDGAGHRIRARDRGSAGTQDRLHRGDRLARRLDRRREARPRRVNSRQEWLWRLSGPLAGRAVTGPAEPGSTRVLIITGDPIGRKMAGPAIRTWNMAM